MPDLVIGLTILLAGVGVAVGVSGGAFTGTTDIDGGDTQPEAEAILATVITSELGAAETSGHDRLKSEAVIEFFGSSDQPPLEDVVPRSEDTALIVTLRAIDVDSETGPPPTFEFISGQAFGTELTRETDSFGRPETAELPSERFATDYAILDGQVVEVEVQTWRVQNHEGVEE